MPPLMIFNRLRPEYKLGADENTMFAQQKSGWMDGDIYERWLETHFIKHVPSVRPLLLIFDGLKAHISLGLIEKAEENDILLYCLPPHSSHLLQPLDVSVFGPLKVGWKRVASTFTHFSGRPLNNFNFARLYKVAWNTSITASVIAGGFKRSGIYPFDRKAVVTTMVPDQRNSPAVPTIPDDLADIAIADIAILPQRKVILKLQYASNKYYCFLSTIFPFFIGYICLHQRLLFLLIYIAIHVLLNLRHTVNLYFLRNV